MILTLPANNELSKEIESALDKHGFIELRSEQSGRVIFLFEKATLEGFSHALTDERLRSAVRQSVTDLRAGEGVSIDPDELPD